MLHTSPGVYTRIVDQSDYINAIPIVSAFSPFFSDRGPDNELVFINGEKTLRNLFPISDHSVYGEYKEGWLCVRNWVRQSGSFYGMRLLPENASYANLLVSLKLDTTNNVWHLDIESVPGINSKDELETVVLHNPDPNIKPLFILHGLGRGASYNNIAINITPSANYDNAYYVDIYDVDAEGDLVLKKDILVTIDPKNKMINGDSELIDKNLALYNDEVRCIINPENINEYLHGTTEFLSYTEMGIMEMADPAGQTIINGKAYYTGDNPTGAFAGNPYSLAIFDGSNWTFKPLLRGSVFYFANVIDQVSAPPTGLDNTNDGERYYIRDDQPATGLFTGHEGEVAVWKQYAQGVTGYWEFQPVKKYMFDGDDVIEYHPFSSIFSAANSNDTDYKFLKEGSEGALLLPNGLIDPVVAEELLIEAYLGNIDGKVINTDLFHFFFNVCPYDSKHVKDAAAQLSYMIRKDNIAIMHVGHNATPDIDIARRNSEFTYNTFLVALYGNYSKVYDNDLKDTKWVSPVYHMSYVLPYTYDIADLATPPAGFERATLPIVEELSYEPMLGDHDNLYNNQVNPIAKFREGYVVWGQLTSQRKTSALQDLNVIVVYLYMKVTLEQYCRYYIFNKDTADEIAKIRTTVADFLKMVQDNALIKEVVTLDVGQTPEEEARKIVHINIVYRPVRSIEKIMITFFVRK